jgi:diguanylate cyclase (GGDEF)-like protein
VDLALWRDFQDNLSEILGVPLSLYDAEANLLAQSRMDRPICTAVAEKTPEKCRELYVKAVSQVLDRGKPYIYKCHINEYVFAVPVVLAPGRAYVVIGGHVYLSNNELKEFHAGALGLGLDEATLARLEREIKVVPPRSIFTLPEIVANLALPFLRCLHALGERPAATEADKTVARGFNALDQVYRSIAPVLDREELYDTILLKSTELVEAERGSLMILDNKNNVLSIKAAKGLDRELTGRLRVKLGEGISGSIAANGIPMVVKNIEAEVPPWKNRPKYKTKSFLAVPLKLNDKVIGVLNISDKSTGGSFSDDDLQLMLPFAHYASIALERGAYYSMSEELKTLSMTDPLTGLFNRRYFRERLFEEVERVKRHNECFTTFIIDIDDFKVFNDRYGHATGDEILKGVSRLIRDEVRSMDVVSRYGGEEFAVILPHTRKQDSLVIAERIRKGIEEYRPPSGGISEWPTISLGVAEFPGDAASIEDLVNKADMAMYDAKKTGKNRVVVYER